MKKIVSLSLLGFVLSGCAADTTRTLPVLVWEDRPIGEIVYRERARLVVPPDYHNPRLNSPRQDPVVLEYKKNNFIGNTPLPPPRPYDLAKPKEMRSTSLPPRKPCSIDNHTGCVK